MCRFLYIDLIALFCRAKKIHFIKGIEMVHLNWNVNIFPTIIIHNITTLVNQLCWFGVCTPNVCVRTPKTLTLTLCRVSAKEMFTYSAIFSSFFFLFTAPSTIFCGRPLSHVCIMSILTIHIDAEPAGIVVPWVIII